MPTLTVRDIMVKNVKVMHPNDSLEAVVNLLSKNGFDGAPVVDSENNVVGIITQYDLLMKSSGIHLPTLERLLGNLPVLKEDLGPLRKSFDDVQKLTAKDVMNPEPMLVDPGDSVESVANLFVSHHRVNPLIVVERGKVVGIVSRYDIIKLYDPHHFAEVLGHFIDGATEHSRPALEAQASETFSAVRRNLLLVSKWRPVLLYVVLAAFFVIVFFAIFSLFRQGVVIN